MTEQQALLKLTTLCTQAEHCSQEMIDKMKKWELPEDAIARNMEFLTEKKFIDDERFARFFINDKIKYNKWGRRKVEQALWMKHIPKDISDPIFEESLLPYPGNDIRYHACWRRPAGHRKWHVSAHRHRCGPAIPVHNLS